MVNWQVPVINGPDGARMGYFVKCSGLVSSVGPLTMEH